MKVLIVLSMIQYFSFAYGLNNSNNTLTYIIDSMLERAEFKHRYAYKIIDRVYNDFGHWFFTIIFCEFTYLENSILQHMETYDYGYPVMLLDGCPSRNSSRMRPKITKHGATAYIITSQELSLEIDDYFISALTRTGVWKPRSKVVFVLTLPIATDGYLNYELKSHFRLLWSSKITNTILILWNDTIRIYMYNRFLDTVIDVTNESDLNKLLDDQYRDFHGYELKLSVYRKIYIPDTKHLVTCDAKLIKTIMKNFNSTCRVLFPRDNLAAGDLFENGTATGVTADLIDGYTDMELNSRILKSSYYGYIDTTYPLSNDDLCFMVPKAGRYSTFMSAFVSISGKVFAMFIGNLLLFITSALIVRYCEIKLNHDRISRQSTGEMALDLIKCVLRQTVEIKFQGPVFRMIVLMIMIYSLIINAAIDGILTTALTYPRLKPDINTLDELAKTKLIIGLHSNHMKVFKDSLSSKLLDEFEKRIEVLKDEDFERVISTKDKKYALLMRLSDIDYIKKRQRYISNGIPVFHAVRECPVPCFIVNGLSYGSPYLPKLDRTLQLLSQGGIFDFWAKSCEYNLYKEGNKILLAGGNKIYKPLDLDILQSVFYLWFGGIVVSAIIFLVEIFCCS